MATIRPRKKADGTISYTAQIRINRDKVAEVLARLATTYKQQSMTNTI